MDWVSKVEIALLALLVIAQVDFVIGSFLPPTDHQMANGFVGLSSDVLKENLWSDYQVEDGNEYSFFKVIQNLILDLRDKYSILNIFSSKNQDLNADL